SDQRLGARQHCAPKTAMPRQSGTARPQSSYRCLTPAEQIRSLATGWFFGVRVMDACAFVPSAAIATATGVTASDTAAGDFAMDVAALRPFLLRRAIHLTNRRELAEDLVQTALTRALQARTLFTPGTNLKGWVATILQHELYSHHRRSWRSASWSDEIAASLS